MTLILRPSQPWPLCPGSSAFVQRLRNEGKIAFVEADSEVAALGTRAHAWAEARIKCAFYPPLDRAHWQEEAEKLEADLPENLLENAGKYVRFVTDVLFGRESRIEWGVETKVPLWYEPEHRGTVDFWWIDPVDVLDVLDYKSGRVEVVAEKNTQLLSYAIGLMDARELWDDVVRVRLGILQPFVGGFRGHEPTWWEVGVEELRRYKQELGWLAQEAREPLVRSRLIPGEKQCRFCPAKAFCPAIEEEARKALGEFERPGGITDQQVFKVLDKAKVFRDYLDAIEDRARDMPESTLKANGWKLQKGARKFSWALPEWEVAMRLQEIGVAPYKQTLRTPTMVRDELGEDESLEGMYQVDYNRPTLKRTK